MHELISISLAAALEYFGIDEVLKNSMEPSGTSFNSMQRLAEDQSIPYNPMINAGAIVIASMLQPIGFQSMVDFTRRICLDREISIDQDVFQSEWLTCARDRSIGYLLQSKRIITSPIDDALRLYTQLCSLSVTADSLANVC